MNATQILNAADKAVMAVWENFSKDVPEAPADGKCQCGASSWSMYEFGYGRSTSMEYTDHWHGYTGGYDDYTNEGILELLICSDCDAAYQQPDVIDYD